MISIIQIYYWEIFSLILDPIDNLWEYSILLKLSTSKRFQIDWVFEESTAIAVDFCWGKIWWQLNVDWMRMRMVSKEFSGTNKSNLEGKKNIEHRKHLVLVGLFLKLFLVLVSYCQKKNGFSSHHHLNNHHNHRL